MPRGALGGRGRRSRGALPGEAPCTAPSLLAPLPSIRGSLEVRGESSGGARPLHPTVVKLIPRVDRDPRGDGATRGSPYGRAATRWMDEGLASLPGRARDPAGALGTGSRARGTLEVDAAPPWRHRTPASASSRHRSGSRMHSRCRGAQAEPESGNGQPACGRPGAIEAPESGAGSQRWPAKAPVPHPGRRAPEPAAKRHRGSRSAGSARDRDSRRSGLGAQVHLPPHRVAGGVGSDSARGRPSASRVGDSTPEARRSGALASPRTPPSLGCVGGAATVRRLGSLARDRQPEILRVFRVSLTVSSLHLHIP